MSRPPVGIERLPARRPTNEPRESMNCKSCRKRKIKCNRLRPACEACQVFQCACVYDAVPKKRGPKTDVLEALLKRVDGLEQKLKDKNKDGSSNETGGEGSEPSPAGAGTGSGTSGISPGSDHSAGGTAAAVTAEFSSSGNVANKAPDTAIQDHSGKQIDVETHDRLTAGNVPEDQTDFFPPQQIPQEQLPSVPIEALLHAYFTRSHAKPFHILDEASFRQRLQNNQIPSFVLGSVCALAARYTPHPNGYQAAVSLGEEYARRARFEVDSDEPSIDCLQTLLLLALAFVASGKGKKAYMLLSNAIGMAVALELHREMDLNARVMPMEREMRRRLFWTCYLLDRFMACGSRRPSLISDSTVLLRLPSWLSSTTSMPVDGDFFQSTSNSHYLQGGGGKRLQGGSGMLIDISRILGITNRYLAAGGVKGDSHFPWHSLSNLSKIRQDLDAWAAGAQDIFSSVETLFSQPDSTVLVMSKLIYHLIHCLIYRPFLPIDLAELSGTGQHQSWQIDATNMCFMHANAIAELTEIGKQMPNIEWPGFVGYCICTAGTVHVHGAHYNKNAVDGPMSLFSNSTEFLAREMQHLSEMRHVWACVQHHRQTLQSIYNAHTVLVKSITEHPMHRSPVFQLEDFFDRYSNIGGPGGLSFSFDASNLILADVVVDFAPEISAGNSLFTSKAAFGHRNDETRNHRSSDMIIAGGMDAMDVIMSDQPNLKRNKTIPPIGRTTLGTINIPNSGFQTPHSIATPSHRRPSFFTAQSSTPILMSPSALSPHIRQQAGVDSHMMGKEVRHSMVDAAGFSLGPPLGLSHQTQSQTRHQSQPKGPEQEQLRSMSSEAPFSPSFNLSPLSPLAGNTKVHGLGSSAFSGTPQGNHSLGITAQGNNTIELSGYDPMFANIPTNAFSSPSPWHVDDSNAVSKQAAIAHKPSPDGGRSNDGSAGGTVISEEKDPFLSLLEQLADNEYARGPGNELDFFLAGTTGSA